MTESFQEFMRRREAASNDYIRGDAGQLAAMLTPHDPATFMPPNGSTFVGAEASARAQVDGASMFGLASEGRFDVLHYGASGDLAFWTGRQVATVDINGRDEPVPMVLRVTEVFRLEDGDWKLVHRHADMHDSADQ